LRLALAAVVAFMAAPAGAEEGVGSIAASIESAVGAAAESETAVLDEPVVSESECARPRVRTREDKKPHLSGKAAIGVGLVAGGLAGFGMGEGRKPDGPPTPLRGWGTRDWVVAGSVASVWASTRLFDRPSENLAGDPSSNCSDRQDQLNAFDLRIAKALGGKVWRQQASDISDATLSASVALPFALALGANPDERGRDMRVALGTLATNIALTDVVKRLAGRPRPYARFRRPYHPEDLAKDDAHYSFYSGHSSTSFAMAVAAGMLSHYHGYRNEAGVWATGLTLATTTGVLRIAADQHYASDVIGGAAAGALVGWLVPRLHRPAGMPQSAARKNEPPAATMTLPLRLGGASGEGVLRTGFGTGPFVEATWRW
jgi:membrane-associated phospholipid phosphatase